MDFQTAMNLQAIFATFLADAKLAQEYHDRMNKALAGKGKA